MSEMVFKIAGDDTDGGCVAHTPGHFSATKAFRCHFDEGKSAAVLLANRSVAA
jgi:hypothetical protein